MFPTSTDHGVVSKFANRHLVPTRVWQRMRSSLPLGIMLYHNVWFIKIYIYEMFPFYAVIW
jgi:hypothetical protein